MKKIILFLLIQLVFCTMLNAQFVSSNEAYKPGSFHPAYRIQHDTCEFRVFSDISSSKRNGRLGSFEQAGIISGNRQTSASLNFISEKRHNHWGFSAGEAEEKINFTIPGNDKLYYRNMNMYYISSHINHELFNRLIIGMKADVGQLNYKGYGIYNKPWAHDKEFQISEDYIALSAGYTYRIRGFLWGNGFHVYTQKPDHKKYASVFLSWEKNFKHGGFCILNHFEAGHYNLLYVQLNINNTLTMGAFHKKESGGQNPHVDLCGITISNCCSGSRLQTGIGLNFQFFSNSYAYWVCPFLTYKMHSTPAQKEKKHKNRQFREEMKKEKKKERMSYDTILY